MAADYSARPNTIPWPPIIYLAMAVAALALGAAWPLGSPPRDWHPWLWFAGAAIASTGIALDVAAMLAMRRARTTILPHRGADRLVTDGVFALTRNPIYVGNTLLLGGLGVALGSAWMIAGALLAALLVDRLAIQREERHLSVRFGLAYAEYVARVPRWIGLRR